MIDGNNCEEIFEFLSYMNKEEVMKVPKAILKFIKENRNSNFNTKIDKNDLFNFNNLSEKSLDFLIYIDTAYWKENTSNPSIQEQNENKENMMIVKKTNILQKILSILNRIKK